MYKDLGMRIIENIPLTVDFNPTMFFLVLCSFLYCGIKELIVALHQFTLSYYTVNDKIEIKVEYPANGVIFYKRLK